MPRKIPVASRMLFSLLCGGIGTAALAAPWLEAHGYGRASAQVYALFSSVCHQDPGRSFACFGHPLAVCHRCTGIYVALFLTSLWPFELSLLLQPPRRRRLWILAATMPLLWDAVAPLAGLWVNTQTTRFLTGLLFGWMLASLLVPAVSEFILEIRSRIGRVECDPLGGPL